MAGLQRGSVTSCSRWAPRYRVMGQPFPGPFSFAHHPWAREMHDCKTDLVGRKAAQMAFTETAMNKTFYTIDVERQNVLYILPSATPDASDFSATRFDPALELSPHLRSLFSDVKNSGVKRAGSACLFIRGSRSRSHLKSIPASLVIFDEVDEMVQEHIPLALERGSGQQSITAWFLSTPTRDNFGIDALYQESTREHYFFKCPTCGKFTELDFFKSLVVCGEHPNDPAIQDSHVITECGHKLDFATKHLAMQESGKWVPENPSGSRRGFYINQLYSSMPPCHPTKIAATAIAARTNPAAEQELWNSKAGLPHLVEGARILDGNIDTCVGTHKNGDVAPSTLYRTMGIDVGKMFHFQVNAWNPLAQNRNTIPNESFIPRVMEYGKVADVDELDEIIIKHRINFLVIDAHPEDRIALALCRKYAPYARRCIYGSRQQKRDIEDHFDTHYCSVHRTSWLDITLGRYKNRQVILPMDINEEYREHLKEPARVYRTNPDGVPTAVYVNGRADHYAHAANYAEIALAVGLGIGVNSDL